MARKTVKVDIPVGEPDKFTKLASDIINKHNNDGPASPLHHLDMATFETKTNDGIAKRNQAADLHGQAEALNEEANVLLGISEGQNSQTPATIYHIITKVRDQLLVTHRGNEEKLNLHGFEVVVSEA